VISPIDSLAPSHCSCGWSDDECVCEDTEKGLRLVGQGRAAMTSEQRAWCLQEIDQTKGYLRAAYEQSTDVELASGTLQARTNFCRNRGFLSRNRGFLR
jgi:hypothetical protein